MLKHSIAFIQIILLLLVAFPDYVRAQTGTCEPAVAEDFLDVNNVRARILSNGPLFWRGSPHIYEVPKYGNANAIFAAGIWVGGMMDGEVRMAASRYGPWEFWPGPLDDQGNPPADCASFDRIYSIYLRDIDTFNKTGEASDDLRNWPWQLGAPVVDGDGNPDNYNLEGGDRPEIIGHQTLWWVMNDRGNVHEATDSNPIGLEIQVTAFAATSINEHINNATLYRYKIINKNDRLLEDAHFGFFTDIDLGNFDDDYIGSDTTLGMGYAYNSDNFDEGGEGYGEAPPAIGYDVVQGPLVNNDSLDNDRDGAIDEEDERLSMTSFIFFNSGGDVNGDPITGEDYYNFLKGRWKDGKPFTVGGAGRDFSNIPTSFFFPGDPVTGEGWSELNPDPFNNSFPPIPPADRRSAVGTGPFTMQPGTEQEIVIAVIWARGKDNLDSVSELRNASRTVQQTFDDGFEVMLPNIAPLTTVSLAAPANAVAGQPIDPILQWDILDIPTLFDVEWGLDSTFETANREEILLANSHRIFDLEPFSTYYWRVRAVNAGERGPWSEAWQFTTSDAKLGSRLFDIDGFMTTQNAAGPIDPADMAAFAFDDLGFPVLEGNLTPEGSYLDPLRPTAGVQQSTNSSIWGIHTGGGGRIFFDNDAGQSFVERSLRANFPNISSEGYEWRFTQDCIDQIDGTITEDDCLAWRAFYDALLIEVPFSLWDIGLAADSTDDYRLIPIICEEACGAGTETSMFDIGNDHDSSDGDNDPYSDWVYWYQPINPSPGEQGYKDFFSSDLSELGNEIMARTVLVQLDAGEGPTYDVALPEPGTIFRIATSPVPAPLLSAPRDKEIRGTPTTALYWNAPSTTYHLQIDRAPDFPSPLINLDFLSEPSFVTDLLPKDNTYYWRVRYISAGGDFAGAWSETWSFTIPQNVSTEPDGVTPIDFALEPAYPNPFSTITNIRYALPAATEVRLEVFDTLGRRVHVLVDTSQPAGWHEASFNAKNLSSGVYFYRLITEQFTDTKTMIITR